MIEAAGASLLYLPPSNPDFNPIENAFAKLEALLRKAAQRTLDGLWNVIGRSIDCSRRSNAETASSPQAMLRHDRRMPQDIRPHRLSSACLTEENLHVRIFLQPFFGEFDTKTRGLDSAERCVGLDGAMLVDPDGTAFEAAADNTRRIDVA